MTNRCLHMFRVDKKGNTLCPHCSANNTDIPDFDTDMPLFHCGVGHWKDKDVVFASYSKDVTPGCVYSVFVNTATPVKSCETDDALSAAIGYANMLKLWGEFHGFLIFDADGSWYLYTHEYDDEGGSDYVITESYDHAAQQETDMADQAHINDLRFGAASDDPGWYDDADWHAHPDDYYEEYR